MLADNGFERRAASLVLKAVRLVRLSINDEQTLKNPRRVRNAGSFARCIFSYVAPFHL